MASAQTWRGIVVAPEQRCSPYSSKNYPYPQSVERRIVGQIGKMYGPYTGKCFTSLRQTDIEHIIARSEAHDSGLCAASTATRHRFASDLLNLTIAGPSVNRHQKSGKDAADWMPSMNRCWFASRVVAVRLKYGLTIDRREAETLERVLSKCSSTELIVGPCVSTESPVGSSTTRSDASTGSADALNKWDDNGNGRITCKEAKRHGIAPVMKGHPAYAFMNDRDGDGVVCE